MIGFVTSQHRKIVNAPRVSVVIARVLHPRVFRSRRPDVAPERPSPAPSSSLQVREDAIFLRLPLLPDFFGGSPLAVRVVTLLGQAAPIGWRLGDIIGVSGHSLKAGVTSCGWKASYPVTSQGFMTSQPDQKVEEDSARLH